LGQPVEESFQFLGIKFGGQWGDKSLLWNLEIPYWMIVLAMLAFLAISIGWWRRERKRRQLQQAGMCPRCGYDLRATPDRCSECGSEVARASSP
jgi:hypothetical protein